MKILHSGDGGHAHAHGGGCSHGHSHAAVDDSMDPETQVSLVAGSGHSHNHSHSHEHSHDAPVNKEKKRNLNVEAAYLHILGDVLNSIGVIFAAAVILLFPSLWWLDPVCTYFFSAIVFYTTRLTFMQCINILLEGAPHEGELDTDDVLHELRRLEGVAEVHDLHIWALSAGKFCCSVHLKVHETFVNRQQEVLERADNMIRQKFKINHMTIQIEAPTLSLPSGDSTNDSGEL